MKTRKVLPLLALGAALAACDEDKTLPPPSTSPSAVASAAVVSAVSSALAAKASSATGSAAPAAAPVPAVEPSAYDIDAAHSRVGFAVRHMMVSNTRGEFRKYAGTIFVDEGDLSKTTLDVAVDTDSVDTGDKKRDDHLRSPDFFDSKKFPKMTFKSTKVERKAAGGYTVTGDLTIRDKTKPVTLDVEALSAALKDPWGAVHRGTRATAKINRTDFDLKWNKSLESGGVLVAEEVSIELELELVKKGDKK